MPLFKKKPDTLIPPVLAPPASSLPSTTRSRSSPNTYPNTATARQNDAPYYSPDFQPPNRNKGVVYSRDTAELDKDRNELFSGYKPPKSGSGRFFDRPNVEDNKAGEDEADDKEEDVEGIKRQIRFTKQESVNSTKNALRLAREAEETGRNTLGRLDEQSVRLQDTERSLNTANVHTSRALDSTHHLKKLNRSIFLPVIHKDKKRVLPEVPDEDETNYSRRRDIGDNLINGDSLVGGRMKRDQHSREQYKRYQFDATASDDEMEEEMSDDLDEILKTTKRLGELGRAMGEELDRQNEWIGGIAEKTDNLDGKIRVNIDKLKKVK